MVQKIHPRGVIWVKSISPMLVACHKKNDDLAVQYEDVRGLSNDWILKVPIAILKKRVVS